MKARVKATGVIVDVKCLDNNNWYDKLNDEYYLYLNAVKPTSL